MEQPMATIDTVQARLAAIAQDLHDHNEAIRLLLLERGRLTQHLARLNGQGQEASTRVSDPAP